MRRERFSVSGPSHQSEPVHRKNEQGKEQYPDKCSA
jgi:hypothetical protein